MEFSCIKLPSGSCVDALLFQIGKDYGLIIWDSTPKEECLTQTQQKCNELSLLIEGQKNRMTRLHDDAFFGDLFQALNFAVLEMNAQGHFVLTGTPPAWVQHIPQSGRILAGMAYEEDAFSFLGNFIREAKSGWSKHRTDSFKSGLWIEKDDTGQELFFEATAVHIYGRKLIIISHDLHHPMETNAIIQKGRELALSFHSLKRSGRKLKSMHDELETRVKERTKELEEATLNLANELKERKKAEKEREEISKRLRQSQKMEAIGTLAGGISHDFNNILAAIIGFTELSLADANATPLLKDRLEKTLFAANRAKDLVRQILTFSHQTEYEKKPLKLKQTVTEVLNLLQASMPANIHIQTDLKSNACILADQTQMHQVIMNLCTNAWHSMKKTGGTLCIGLKDADISSGKLVGLSRLMPGRYLLLSIQDSGCGIRPDIIEKIFDPYFTTKGKDKGTGLGLSIVHGIVSQLKGTITIASQVGKGSTFTIYLPTFDRPDNAAPSKELPPAGKNETILLVDDEPFQTEMTGQILNRLGYRVVTCNDGLRALDIFREQRDRFDLVITDMVMPKMTGDRLSEKILEIRPDIPILLCSGYSDDIIPENLEKIGITQYLMKPYSMMELARSVQGALKQKSVFDVIGGSSGRVHGVWPHEGRSVIHSGFLKLPGQLFEGCCFLHSDGPE
nr:response regulator [Desulfobacula sp.]